MQACPVQDEQMLDIIDIRRQQVIMKGEFPTQLQSAFCGMERVKNSWGINHDRRMQWYEGLTVKTIDENPDPTFSTGSAALPATTRRRRNRPALSFSCWIMRR